MSTTSWIRRVFYTLVLSFAPYQVVAETALVAVATNFSEVVEKLKSEFEASHDHKLTIVTGSTGKLYAQIVNGAPFDVFLAADQTRPELLVKNEYAQPESQFTLPQARLYFGARIHRVLVRMVWMRCNSHSGASQLPTRNLPPTVSPQKRHFQRLVC